MDAASVSFLHLLGDLPPSRFEDAACIGVDPEVFYPATGQNSREAMRYCQSCSIRLACLEYSIRNKIYYGIWGGVSEKKRQRMIRGNVYTVQIP